MTTGKEVCLVENAAWIGESLVFFFFFFSHRMAIEDCPEELGKLATGTPKFPPKFFCPQTHIVCSYFALRRAVTMRQATKPGRPSSAATQQQQQQQREWRSLWWGSTDGGCDSLGGGDELRGQGGVWTKLVQWRWCKLAWVTAESKL